MNGTSVNERVQAWVVDYSAARMRAISWLGDRYLLAKPINANANRPRAARTRTSFQLANVPSTE